MSSTSAEAERADQAGKALAAAALDPDPDPAASADTVDYGLLSERLAACQTAEECAAVWQDYVERFGGQLTTDTEIAGQLILIGDLDGLKRHLSRHSRARARARVAAIHSVVTV
jgi:hypothetical protein